jgi:hypothetical protein
VVIEAKEEIAFIWMLAGGYLLFFHWPLVTDHCPVGARRRGDLETEDIGYSGNYVLCGVHDIKCNGADGVRPDRYSRENEYGSVGRYDRSDDVRSTE